MVPQCGPSNKRSLREEDNLPIKDAILDPFPVGINLREEDNLPTKDAILDPFPVGINLWEKDNLPTKDTILNPLFLTSEKSGRKDWSQSVLYPGVPLIAMSYLLCTSGDLSGRRGGGGWSCCGRLLWRSHRTPSAIVPAHCVLNKQNEQTTSKYVWTNKMKQTNKKQTNNKTNNNNKQNDKCKGLTKKSCIVKSSPAVRVSKKDSGPVRIIHLPIHMQTIVRNKSTQDWTLGHRQMPSRSDSRKCPQDEGSTLCTYYANLNACQPTSKLHVLHPTFYCYTCYCCTLSFTRQYF